jgi:hypothetical protein
MGENPLASSSPSDPAPISQALLRLEDVTRHQRRYGQLVAALTIITVAGSITLAFYRVFHVIESVFLSTLIVVAVSALCALLLAVFFESRRKEGDVFFKEISDELQWYVRFGSHEGGSSGSRAPEQRPDLHARLALRSFAQTSELPLVPGAYGPLAYALINIVSVALTAVSLLSLFGKY